MSAEIISIGNELLNGRTVNSNAGYIARGLHEIGVSVSWVQTIRDDSEMIYQALDIALQRSGIVLITGGLGPTHDDITKKVIADYFNKKLVFNEEIFQSVKKRFEDHGLTMPENNRSQAEVPEGVELMPNPVGTARGMIFSKEKNLVFVMPGVPKEMQAMMDNSVIPKILKIKIKQPVSVDTFRTTGIPESEIYQRIESDLSRFSSYEIAFLPKFTGVDIRVIRGGGDIKDEKKFDDFCSLLEAKIGEFIYTRDERELEEIIGALLRGKKATLSVAESLTGGLIEDKITNVSGSSEYFMGGAVSYSNEAKISVLGVKRESLEKYGAVSEAVAGEMSAGVRRLFKTDYGLATTGIAGPTGATETKPVGLVYIGVVHGSKISVKKFRFGSDRQINKERSAQAALELLRRKILKMSL